MKYVKLFEEFNYDEHKEDDVQIIDRFLVSINPGTDDVLEVEGLLAKNKFDELIFKPLSEVKIFKSSDSLKLIKDEEITLNQADVNTSNAVNHLNKNINKWLIVETDNSGGLVRDINVGKVIQVGGKGTSMIGGLNCIFNTIKFEKI
jgi:hypothetical protein